MPQTLSQAELSAHIQHLIDYADAPVVVALDGRCGSGKTTLAALLARQFPASVLLHMDDFYLPPQQRVSGWEQIPCANMDLERLLQELLLPLAAGQNAVSRAYSCQHGSYQPPVLLHSKPLILLEGSYSHHPSLCGCETLRVFVTCSKEQQLLRLKSREGQHFSAFEQRWIPLEEHYFAQFNIPSQADFLVDTTPYPEQKQPL